MRPNCVAIAIVLGWAAFSGAATQQSPFKPPSNLRVLPKDTKLADIVPMMKNFTQALHESALHCGKPVLVNRRPGWSAPFS